MGLSGPFGDIDNDGDEDLVLADWQGSKYTIYKNDGYGNFHSIGDLTKSVDAMAALIDMDGDSYLDLVDINLSGGKIYTNDGTGNYSGYEHINISPPHPSSGPACICFGDADDDHDLDLYIGVNWSTDYNPNERNMFYLNNGAGIFVKEPDTSAFVSDMKPTLGSNWVDYDNDGDMDLYVVETSFYGDATEYTSTLYENKGGLAFEEHVIEPPEYCNTHKVSPVWGDLDNDGDQDLYIAVEKT
ncbi:MAG: FG-GAP repeat domain-containing protein, partial [Anaerolineales bacterium]